MELGNTKPILVKVRRKRYQMFCKIDILKNFAEFTGKHQRFSVFRGYRGGAFVENGLILL